MNETEMTNHHESANVGEPLSDNDGVGQTDAASVPETGGSVPEVTNPDSLDFPEPELGDVSLSADVEDESDVRSALAEAADVENAAQQASNQVGGAARVNADEAP